jgi:hypothetical protein
MFAETKTIRPVFQWLIEKTFASSNLLTPARQSGAQQMVEASVGYDMVTEPHAKIPR